MERVLNCGYQWIVTSRAGVEEMKVLIAEEGEPFMEEAVKAVAQEAQRLAEAAPWRGR